MVKFGRKMQQTNCSATRIESSIQCKILTKSTWDATKSYLSCDNENAVQNKTDLIPRTFFFPVFAT